DVEDDDVGVPLAGEVHALGAGLGREDVEGWGAEGALERVADRGFVVDEEEGRHRSIRRCLAASPASAEPVATGSALAGLAAKLISSPRHSTKTRRSAGRSPRPRPPASPGSCR